MPDTCQTPPGGKCYGLVQDYVDPDTGRLQTERIYGCLPADEDGFLFQCGVGRPTNGKTIVCCDSGDMCNRNLQPEYTARKHSEPAAAESLWPYVGLATAITVVLGMALAIVVWVVRRRRRRTAGAEKDAERQATTDGHRSTTTSTAAATATAAAMASPSIGVDGAPMLVQRTIVKEIAFTRPIGRGRFGEVWLAQFRGERVAVKVFQADAERMCLREAEIYKSVMMRHENIQRFIGSDIDSNGRRILVTHYHELGTLHGLLAHANAPLTAHQLLELAFSLAAGLAHLHTEICGLSGKPAIAHGDINSRNVLVRRDMQCVIADFGMAVKYRSDCDQMQLAPSAQPSDWRYVAPECLNDTFVEEMFESYKMADMYAAGLVWWQMARCYATGDGQCEGYALPYADMLPAGGGAVTLDDVRRVVCSSDGERPTVPARWEESGDELLRMMRGIVVDCWKEKSSSRLTSMRVKKTLGKLRDNPVD